MIRDFDQIDEQQMMSPGSATPGSSPLVRALIAEGDPAVEPLLTALETDMRLTRSVSFGRGMVDRTLRSIPSTRRNSLPWRGSSRRTNSATARYLLRPDDVAARKKIAQAIRAFWLKNRAISIERTVVSHTPR